MLSTFTDVKKMAAFTLLYPHTKDRALMKTGGCVEDCQEELGQLQFSYFSTIFSAAGTKNKIQPNKGNKTCFIIYQFIQFQSH